MIVPITIVLIGLTAVHAESVSYPHSGSLKSGPGPQTNVVSASQTGKYYNAPQSASYAAAVSPGPQLISYAAVPSAPQAIPYSAGPTAPQAYSAGSSVPQAASYSAIPSAPQGVSYSVGSSVPQAVSYSAIPSAPQGVSYSAGSSVPQAAFYSAIPSSPQVVSYSAGSSVPQAAPYSAIPSTPQGVSYSAGSSAPQAVSYNAAPSVPQAISYSAVPSPQPLPYVAASSAPQPTPYVAVSPKLLSTPVSPASATPTVAVGAIAAAPKFAPVAQVKSGIADKDAQIVNEGREVGYDGSFNYGFETENGISVKSKGYIKPAVSPTDEPIQVIEGSYTYFDAYGKPQTIQYIADEHGYRAFGEAIPQPPEEILKTLAHRR